jgi:hypothetical protein
VIAVSILLMILMSGLAMSLLGMVFKATHSEKVDLVPLSISISLIFGLPALRNVQPGVPPVGGIWGLSLLHLGRNYRGVVGHHSYMDLVAAVTGASAIGLRYCYVPAVLCGNCFLLLHRVAHLD